MRNQLFANAKTKTQINCAVTGQLISAFVFATRIVQSLFYLNLKFQASNHLLWLYSLVCVGPGRKPESWFSHDTAHIYPLYFQEERYQQQKLKDKEKQRKLRELEESETTQPKTVLDNDDNDLFRAPRSSRSLHSYGLSNGSALKPIGGWSSHR